MENKLISTSNILVPISLGELIDKISILQIKKDYMSGDKLKNVEKELELLTLILLELDIDVDNKLIKELKDINYRLWHIEEDIRIKDSKNEFDYEFIHLASSVYKVNDKRALIKRLINQRYNSSIVEEKFYKNSS